MIEVKSAAKIKTENINFNLNDKLSTNMFVESFDYSPFIFIKKTNNSKGTNISPLDIISLKLYNNGFLPKIELYCEDSKGILFNNLYPFDHDLLVCVFIKSNSELTYPIRMDFICSIHETINQNSNSYKFLLKGILNIDDLNYTRYESKKGTSYNVLKDLSKQFNLGWASNVNKSNDEMVWINPRKTYITFIKEITKHAFISENSFVWSFIDFYYNINYIDIQKQLNDINNDEKATITNNQLIKKDEERIILNYLTNNVAFNMTNKYITKFNLVNQSLKINFENKYKNVATWYNDNIIHKEYLNELITDDSNLQSQSGLLNQLTDKESKLYYQNVNDDFKIIKIDDDNTHKNYALAKISNKYNLDKLTKIKMILTLNQINFSIKRFQNIKIDIYNQNDVFSESANKEKPLNNINKTLSGFWFVTGINYIFKRSGGLEQEIIVMRRDLSINYGNDEKTKHDLRKLIK